MAFRVDKSPSSPIDELLDEATRLLLGAAHPEKIILFGSYARGDFHEGSDLDLLIIRPTVVDRFEEMGRLRLVLRDIPNEESAGDGGIPVKARLQRRRGRSSVLEYPERDSKQSLVPDRLLPYGQNDLLLVPRWIPRAPL